MALQLRRGHTSSLGKVIATSFAVVALIIQPLVSGNIPAAFADDGIDTQAELVAAIADPAQSIIDLTGSFVVDTKISINRALTLNGGGFTISSSRDNNPNDNSNNAVLGIDNTVGVIVTNLKVDRGTAKNIHGINIWRSTATLNNVTITNFNNGGIKYGLIVGENSQVTVNNITTSGNSLGINVDKGTPRLTVNGVSRHGEATAIYVDSGNASYVVDTNSQYTSTNFFGLAYSLKPVPAVPTGLSYASPARACGSVTTINYAKPQWGAVSGVASYDYQALYNGAVVYSTNFATNQHPGGTFGSGQNGVWAFQVRSVGTNGMKSDWSPVCSITLDTVAPDKPTHEFPANDAFINYNSFYFDWSDVTGASSYEVQFSQSDSTDSNGALNVGVWAGDASHNQPTESRAWSSGANGTWYWQVRAVDAAGNKSGWTVPGKVTIDMVAPEVTIASASQTDTTTANFEGTVSDANLRYYYCYLTTNQTITVGDTTYTPGQEVGMRDANCNTTWANGQTNFNGSLGGFDITGLPTGSYTVNLVAYDRAGNNNAGSPATYTFTIEATPENNGNEGGEGNGSNTPGNNQNPGGPATTGDNGEVPNTEDDDDDTDGDANNQVFTAPIVALGNQGVLGTNTDNGGNQSSAIDSGDISDQEVKGTSDEKQDGTFSPLGFAWYWWVLLLAAIAGLWWIIAARKRQSEE